MRFVVILCVFVFTSLVGCDKLASQQHKPSTVQKITPAEAEKPVITETKKTIEAVPEINKQAPQAQAFQPFYIYTNKGSRKNHYVPSGFMPNGNCVTFSDVWQSNCQSGKTCIKVTYDVECSRKDEKWAGVYWLNPANNWGKRKGGYDLTGAQKLTFWAKGEKGGEQIQEFTIGGISGDYPDTDTAVIGPVILGTSWRQYTIDLRGKDLSYISGGFAWTTSEDVNPEDCTFYLDEIRFE